MVKILLSRKGAIVIIQNKCTEVLSKRRQIMSDNTVLGGKPFEDLRSVADAALKIMTGQPQEVRRRRTRSY